MNTLDVVMRPIAVAVRHKVFHQVMVLVYLAITVGLVASPTLRESILLVLAISVETALSTHIDGWAIEEDGR
jgi:hypothetical protein